MHCPAPLELDLPRLAGPLLSTHVVLAPAHGSVRHWDVRGGAGVLQHVQRVKDRVLEIAPAVVGVGVLLGSRVFRREAAALVEQRVVDAGAAIVMLSRLASRQKRDKESIAILLLARQEAAGEGVVSVEADAAAPKRREQVLLAVARDAVVCVHAARGVSRCANLACGCVVGAGLLDSHMPW